MMVVSLHGENLAELIAKNYHRGGEEIARLVRLHFPDVSGEEAYAAFLAHKPTPRDIEALAKRNAKQLLDRITKPGETEPAGLLVIPGYIYFWEPDRAICVDGKFSFNNEADLTTKTAEANMARYLSHNGPSQAQRWADILSAEIGCFEGWLKWYRGDDPSWGRCVRARGYLRPLPSGLKVTPQRQKTTQLIRTLRASLSEPHTR